tara:strand:+ start:468 stop:890 length:423 start_codon:yes stop_codon:yes gene_type:complete
MKGVMLFFFLSRFFGGRALHATLSPSQGRDMARRWSIEYQLKVPVGSQVHFTRSLETYVDVLRTLRDVDDGDPDLACVVQHTLTDGLALFVLRRDEDAWTVVKQLPTFENTTTSMLARERAARWFCRLHEKIGENTNQDL